MVERAHKIGREYERALEDGDDQQGFRLLGRDRLGHGARTVRDLPFVEQNSYTLVTAHRGSECTRGSRAVREAHHQVLAVFRRGREAAAEHDRFTGIEPGFGRRCGPAVKLIVRLVAYRDPQGRNEVVSRRRLLILPLQGQNRARPGRAQRPVHVGESQAAQVHRQADRLEEAGARRDRAGPRGPSGRSRPWRRSPGRWRPRPQPGGYGTTRACAEAAAGAACGRGLGRQRTAATTVLPPRFQDHHGAALARRTARSHRHLRRWSRCCGSGRSAGSNPGRSAAPKARS